jgi:hypothetical protein
LQKNKLEQCEKGLVDAFWWRIKLILNWCAILKINCNLFVICIPCWLTPTWHTPRTILLSSSSKQDKAKPSGSWPSLACYWLVPCRGVWANPQAVKHDEISPNSYFSWRDWWKSNGHINGWELEMGLK